MKNLLIATFLMLLTCACENNTTYFEQPQPVGSASLNSIPKEIHGTYFSKQDSSYLDISASALKETSTFSFNLPRDSVELLELEEIGISPDNLQKDTVLNLQHEGMDVKLKISGDSVYIKASGERTIFDFYNGSQLKQYNGIYFLNILKTDDSAWQVHTIEKRSDSLFFNRSTTGIKINSLREITKVDSLIKENGKTKYYTINPTLKELKEILKANSNSTQSYGKIK